MDRGPFPTDQARGLASLVRRAARGLRCALLLAACAAAPLAGLPDAQGQTFTPEYRAAFEAMQTDPGNAEKALAFAQVAIETGDIEGALSALERLLIFNPDLPRIRVEIGILYFRLGSFEEARAQLRRVLDEGKLAADDRARAEDYLSRTERNAASLQWRANFTSGMRWQSNANYGPQASTARLLGFDFPISGSGQKRADWSFFGAYGGGLSWDPDLATWIPFVVEANVNGFGQKQFKREDLDLFYIQPDIGPRFRLDMISQGLTIRPYGLANYFAVQADNFLKTTGGGVNVNAPVTDWFILDVTLEAQDRHYKQSALRPRVEDRTGGFESVQVRPSFAIASNQVFSLLLERDKVEARERYQRAVYYVAGGNYLIRYGAPFAVTEQPWYTGLSLTRTWRDYRVADVLIDPDHRQHDRQWDIAANQTVGLLESLSLVVQAQKTINVSNIPNYQYRNFTILTALAVQF